MAGGRKGLLSEEKADPSDMANDEPSDASEVEDGGSDDLSRDKDTGFPLTDAASGSDRRTWVGGQRIVQRRVYGPQPYNLDKYQHELVYHKKAGVYKGKPYKAGDPDLGEMSKHLKTEHAYEYMKICAYPCDSDECKAVKTCFVSKSCDTLCIVYDTKGKLPYDAGDFCRR